MKHLIYGLILFILTLTVSAVEKLVVIQAVSESARSFAIRQGQAEGVVKGQSSLFTNEDAGVIAIAKEVNRRFSVWELRADQGTVPFRKGQEVIYSNSPLSVWLYLPKYQLNHYLKIPEDLAFRPSSEWVVRGHYSYALSESISQTNSERYVEKLGFKSQAFGPSAFGHALNTPQACALIRRE